MEGQPQKEIVLRLVCGGILWGISCLLTAGLFLALAGDDLFRKLILFLLAVGLEGAKILSWRMGRATKVLSVSLIILSTLGSLGASLETVQSYRQARNLVQRAETPQEQQTSREVLSVDRQIDILVDRLAKLPPDFVTATKDLNAELDSLRKSRSAMSAQTFRQEPNRPYQETMFDLMAKVFGIPTETLMLILLLFLSVNLEVAALVLAGHPAPTGPIGHLSDTVLSPQRFLEAAKEGARLPLLHGRDVTARKLGISSYDAKKLVSALKASGTIKAVGKRLVLCGS